MIQQQSYMKVADNTGAKELMCVLIMFLLPAVLCLFDKVICKTTWDGVKPLKKADESAQGDQEQQ